METLLIWGVVLLLAGLGVGLYAVRFQRQRRDDAARLASTRELGMDKASGQYPLIDAGACIGCGTCVAACPEGDVLGIVSGKAVVINGARCIGHGRCAEACPVGAIQVGLGDITKRDDIPLLDEQRGHRLADDFAAPEDHGVGSVDLGSTGGEQFLAAVRCAGKKAGTPLYHQPDVFRVKAVHILEWSDSIKNGRLVNVLWERQLNQNSVNGSIGIQLLNQCQ